MQPSYGRPQYAPEPPAVALTKARPWLVGLAASATMLVLIAAIGNPPVTRALFRHAETSGFGSRALVSFSVFSWDLGNLSDDMHIGIASLISDIAVLVLVLLLVTALVPRSGSFWRTFLAVWVSVVVAVVIADYVRSAIINPAGAAPENNKAEVVFFSQYSPGPQQVFTAIVFGVLVALFAALVGVLTRRREVVATAPSAPYYAPAADQEQPTTALPQQRTPWSAPPAAVPGPVANPSPWSTTTETGDDQDRTTQLPAVGAPGHQVPDDDGTEHTRAMPRIEDDRPPE